MAVILSAVGCGQEEEVTSYKVHVLDESNPSKSANSPHEVGSVSRVSSRMLGAILPQQDQTWFFKLTGPDEAVATVEQAFETFIQSITFAESKPAWTTPASWRQLPDDAPENNRVFKRFATLMIETSGRVLELSVTSLPSAAGDSEGYLLLNINRWRGQLGLQPTTASRLAQETKKLTLDGATATLVNLLGTSRSSSMGGAPFASGQNSKRPAGASGNSQPTELSYTVPDGWTKTPDVAFSKATFAVTNEGQALRITVSDFDASIPAMRDLSAQVARWRRQLKLERITPQELNQSVQKIKTGSVSGDYVELIGPQDAPQPETILGVIAIEAGTVWVIKLRGDIKLAAREKQNFESFVRSIRFIKSDGSR